MRCLRMLLVMLLVSPSWAAGALGHCEQLLRSANIPLQAELAFVRHHKPLLVTYPFVNEIGNEVLVVFYYKFPVHKQHQIPRITWRPTSKIDRLLVLLRHHPDFYFFKKKDFQSLRQQRQAAQDQEPSPIADLLPAPQWSLLDFFLSSSSTPVPPALREFKDIHKIRHVKAVLFPFLRAPAVKNPHDPDQIDVVADIHERYLRWAIEVMQELGYHSLLSEAVEDIMGRLLQDDFNGLWVSTIEQQLATEVKQGLHQEMMGKIQQLLEVDSRQSIQRPFMPQKKIVW